MNASFIKRLSAYAIDIILVGAIIMLIYYFIPETKTVTNLQRNVAILNENYLNKQINEVDLPTIDSLSGKQNFILFVNRNTLKKESKLYNFSNNNESYTIGDYSIIIFQQN